MRTADLPFADPILRWLAKRAHLCWRRTITASPGGRIVPGRSHVPGRLRFLGAVLFWWSFSRSRARQTGGPNDWRHRNSESYCSVRRVPFERARLLSVSNR